MASDRDVWEVEPLYSTVRVGVDLTPGNLVANTQGQGYFDSPFCTDQQRQGILLAFSYGQGDGANSMQKAGFGNKTQPRHDHTNLDKAGEVPKTGQMLITAFAITFSPQLLRSHALDGTNATSDTNTLVDDTGGQQDFLYDAIAGANSNQGGGASRARAHVIEAIGRAFSPYWQYGENGERHYFPEVGMLSGGSYICDYSQTQVKGMVFDMGDYGIPWTNSGDKTQMRFGFEIAQRPKPNIWAPLGSNAVFWTALSEMIQANNTVQPVPGSWFVSIDMKVTAYGRRSFVNKGA